MGKHGISSTAAWLMSLAAALATVFMPPIDQQASWLVKLLVTLVGAIGFFAVYETSRRLMLRRHYKRLLGKWYYASRPHAGVKFRDMNFAIMEFSLKPDGDLSYSVTLYPTIEGIRKPGSETSRGRATSLALHYDVAAKCVELAFEVEFVQQRAEDHKRKGRLSLHFVEGDACELEGEYISEVWTMSGRTQKRTLSSGQMVATRHIDRLSRAVEAQDRREAIAAQPAAG